MNWIAIVIYKLECDFRSDPNGSKWIQVNSIKKVVHSMSSSHLKLRKLAHFGANRLRTSCDRKFDGTTKSEEVRLEVLIELPAPINSVVLSIEEIGSKIDLDLDWSNR